MSDEQRFIERAEAIERSARADQERRDANAERFLSDGWPELPALKPIALRPVKAQVPEWIEREQEDLATYGECFECGAANKRYHRCPAND